MSMKSRMSVTYWAAREKTFAVEIRAWFDEKWYWNTYLHLFESSPLFNDNDSIMDIPMHGGVTFDSQEIKQPLGGCRYEWMKTTKTKTVGNDYMHLHDDYEHHPSPFDYPDGSIPHTFKHDADNLIEFVQGKTDALLKALEAKA